MTHVALTVVLALVAAGVGAATGRGAPHGVAGAEEPDASVLGTIASATPSSHAGPEPSHGAIRVPATDLHAPKELPPEETAKEPLLLKEPNTEPSAKEATARGPEPVIAKEALRGSGVEPTKTARREPRASSVEVDRMTEALKDVLREAAKINARGTPAKADAPPEAVPPPPKTPKSEP